MEVRHVVMGQTLEYKGLCSVQELYRAIDKWFQSRRFDKTEKKNYEEVNEGHKRIDIELEPVKKISDYLRLRIKVNIFCNHIVDVDIDLHNRKETVQEGDFVIKFDGYVQTDYENKWEMKPFYYFIRSLIDKYVYKGLLHRHEQEVKLMVEQLSEEVKAFLNVTRYKHA